MATKDMQSLSKIKNKYFSSDSAQKISSGGAFSKITQKYQGQTAGASDREKDRNYLIQRMQNAENALHDSALEYDNLGFDAFKTGYEGRTARITTATQDYGDAANRYLRIFARDMAPNDRQSFNTMLSGFQTNSQELLDAYQQKYDVYSKYDTQEAYDEAVKSYEEYQAMLTADPDAIRAEIAELQTVLDDYYNVNNPLPAHELKALQEKIEQQYGTGAEIQDMIAQKEAYINLALRQQESNKLSSVADPTSESYDPDFAKYSGYVSTEKSYGKYASGYGDLLYEYINGANNGIRDELRAAAKSGVASFNGSTYYDNVDSYAVYDLMEPEEVALYNYYYAKEGKESADCYLELLSESLNYRKAEKEFEALEGKHFLEMLYGGVTGVTGWAENVESMFSGKDYIPTTANQYISGMIREDLKDYGPEILGSSLGQMGYDLINTTANMVPSIITSTVIGAINPVAGTAVGAGMMGMSAAGGAYQEALNMGYDKAHARSYSTIVGASEAVLQYLLGGIGKLGGTSKALTRMLEGVDKAALRIAGRLGGSFLSEATEEGLQEVLTPVFQNMILHMDEDVNWEQVAYSAMLGGITGLFFESPNIVSSEIAIQKEGNKVFNKNGLTADAEKVGALINEGLARDADTEAYQIAEHLQQKQASGKSISGQELARLRVENARAIQAEGAAASQDIPDTSPKSLIYGEMGKNGKTALDQVYDQLESSGADTTNTDVVRGFYAYYRAGLTDTATENVKWKGTALTDQQKTMAWAAGSKDATVSRQAAQKGRYVTYTGKDAGLVKNQYSESLASTNPATFNAANRLGEQLGTRVEIKDMADGELGSISDGVVTINSRLLQSQSVEEAFLGVLAHESYHRMMEVAPNEALALRDYVAKLYTAEGNLDETISRYIAGYKGKTKLTEEGALEEITADFIRKNIKDTKLFAEAIKVEENRSWGRRLIDGIKELIAKIKRTVTGKKAQDAASVAATGQKLSTVEEAVRLWEKGLKAATKAVKTSDRAVSPEQAKAERAKNNTAENGGGKMALDLDAQDVQAIQNIGRKSVNEFNSEEIKLLEKFARKYWKNMGTISPFFRAWFGDWRAHDTTKIQFISVNTDFVNNTDIPRGSFRNNDTGWEINSIRDGIDETLNKKGVGSVEHRALADLDNMLKNAVLFDTVVASEPSKRMGKSTVLVHHLYCPITRNGKTAVAKLYVTEDIYEKHRFYLTKIEEVTHAMVSAADNGNIDPRAKRTAGDTSSEITVADVFAFVKEHDVDYEADSDKPVYFRPNPVNPVLLNVDGTPKKFYHGTTEQFTVFDKSKSKRPGFFFVSENRRASTAGYYSKGDPNGMMGVYLRMENPLIVDETADMNAILKNHGDHDGILKVASKELQPTLYYDHESEMVETEVLQKGEIIEAVVFEPEQIKSATDNIGTFDGSNPDIRYSLEGTENIIDEVRAARQVENAAKAQLAYLRKQVAVTKDATADPKSVERIARKLIASYGVEMDADALAQQLQLLYDSVLRKQDTDMWQQATDIARSIAEAITEVDGDIYTEYAELRKILKARTIFVPEGVRSDIADYFDTVRPYRNRLKLTTKAESMTANNSLDIVFNDLAAEYPFLFDADTNAGSDQLRQIMEVTDRLYEHGSQRFLDSWEMEDATAMIACDIFQKAEELKQFKSLKEMQQEQRQAQKDATLAGMMAQGRVDAEKIRKVRENLDRVRRAKYAAIQKVKTRDVRIEKMQENTEVKKYRLRVEKKVKKLSDALLKNSDKEHIPEGLKQVVGNFLNTIDFSSQRLMKRGEQTKRDLSYAQTLSRLRDALTRQGELQAADNGDGAGAYVDLPTGFVDQITEHIQNVENAARGWDTDTNQVYAMNAAQLKDLDFILTVLNHSISQINQLTENARFASAQEAARESILDLNAMGSKLKPSGKVGEILTGWAGWDSATPFYAFQRYGAGGQAIFEGLQNGWDKMADNSKAIIDFTGKAYTAEEVHAWEKEIHKVELQSGKTAQLTTAQVMSLYCLAKREQAVGHLLGGGMRVADFDVKGKKVSQTSPYNLTAQDVAEISGLLTERQKAVADALQEYMNTIGTDWGNEVSMKRFGYRAFTEANYFPITSDPTNLPGFDPEARANDMFRLLNLSLTKSLTAKANNALVVSDIFDVFAAHMADMAKYNALALPILDAMKWYNYKDTMHIGESQIQTQTVQRALETAYGKQANNYFTTFMKDLNGKSEGGRGEEISKKLISNYKVAAVGANLRVALLQPTAYVRAAAVIDPKYLARALKSGSSFKEMEANSGIAKWKGMGFYDTNIGRGLREQIKSEATGKDKLVEKSMLAAEWGDKLTWGVLWNACKLEVAETQKLEGQELLDATAKRFRDVVYQTQVVDSTMTRSHVMRKKSLFATISTAFMSEPTLGYNLMMDAALSWVTSNKNGKAAAAKKFGRVTSAFCVSTLAATIAASIMDAWRDDDEYEDFYEKFLEVFGENLLDDLNPLNKLPIAKDIVSMFAGFDSTRMDLESIQNLVDAINIWTETYNVLVNGGEWTDTTYNGKMTLYGKIYKTMQAVGQIVGLPISSVSREAISLYNNTIAKWFGLDTVKTYDPGAEKSIQYAYLDGYLTDEQARKALVEDAEFETDAAIEKVYYFQFKRDYPNYADLSEKAAVMYVRTLKDMGVNAGSFYDAYKVCSEFDAKDENGNTVNGLKKQRVQEYLKTLTGQDAKYIQQAILQLMYPKK